MKFKFNRHLRRKNNFLHIGCNVIDPESWINIDGSWNAWLSRYPLVKKLLWKLGLISKEAFEHPWPRNILIWDVNKGLSFPDNSVDGIYASHLLEHLSRSKARVFVQECYRVLSRGGVIRLVVPDLRSYIEEYIALKNETPESPLPANKFIELMNTCHWHEWENLSFPLRIYRAMKDFLSHKWVYDRESLMALLQEAGFTGVSEMRFLDSAIPVIADVEREEKEVSVYVEGYKPGGG
jgi:predicted SAM-dependent methyltransferase